MSQTLDRALSILDIVAEKPSRINEIAVHLGVHHSTALRLLHTLRRHGFVHELPDHSYRLGAGAFRLAFQALDALDLRSIALPYMEKLNEQTGETVHLGTLEDGDVVYIEKVEARHRVRMHSRIGAHAPLHCTGVAKGIVAFLPQDEQERLLRAHKLDRFTDHTRTSLKAVMADLGESRERGYSLDDEENEPGIHCIGAPIMFGDGSVAGAISLTAPMSRVDRETLVSFVPSLVAAAQGASRELGWRG